MLEKKNCKCNIILTMSKITYPCVPIQICTEKYWKQINKIANSEDKQAGEGKLRLDSEKSGSDSASSSWQTYDLEQSTCPFSIFPFVN